MQTFHIAINLDLTWRGSCKGHNHNTYQMGPKFLVNVIFCAQPLDSMTSLKKKNPQMLWLVHDIQILWHHCCEIHTLMQQSDWCEIHNLMRWSDWCEQHTTLQANITFSLIKKIKNSKRLKLPRHQYIWTPSINDLCYKNIYSVWAVTNQ